MACHAYVRFLLKTPTGFLTPTGTTQDICDKDIIILNIAEAGGYMASKWRQIQEFLKYSTAKVNSLSECEVWCHTCDSSIAQYSCKSCSAYSSCNLLHNRKMCKFKKV